MPLPRFQNLPPERRRAIIDAAGAEFAEHGFEGASFNRIIAAAGISKGAMYYYFADKADAYGAVLDDVLDRMVEAVQDLPTPTSARSYWAMLSAGMGRLNESFFADERLAALARSLYQGSSGPAYQRLLARTLEWVRRLVALGQELGAVRDDVPQDLLVDAVTGLMVSIDRWFATAFERHAPEELMPLVPKIMELVRDLLRKKRSNQ